MLPLTAMITAGSVSLTTWISTRLAGSAANNYIYRIVEGTVDKAGNFTAVKPNETITINGNTYVVTAEAEATANSETNSAGSSTDNTATANSETNSETGATTTPATVTPDGTITGGSGKIVLTNTLQNPKFALDIIKKDAGPNNAGEEVFLKDVEFKPGKAEASKNWRNAVGSRYFLYIQQQRQPTLFDRYNRNGRRD